MTPLIMLGQFEIPVIAAGNGWLVVEKPWGMSVHNDPGSDLVSLARCGPGTAGEFGIHPVHRLDRETSGVMILCTEREALRFFARQFEAGTVIKRYVAVLHGRMATAPGDGEWSAWEWPLTAAAGGRRFPQGRGEMKECRTRFRVREASRHYTMVECEPLSGRTHQIRRHARLAGHPVVGDRRYGSARSIAHVREQRGFTRLALHAMEIRVVPPGEHRPVTFRSSAVPAELRGLLAYDSRDEVFHP
ncbi:MAG TPA: RNA pseudouridine synthase [Desulfobacterales bacterium]|nr:RNA pseudouridine synthase [Desulfobacterales bacterium]